MTTTTTAPAVIAHPLDPLNAGEIERAWQILSAERAPGPKSRVIFIVLHEPDKKVVLGYRPGDRVDRAAFLVFVDNATGRTYEAVVSLDRGRVVSWEHIAGRAARDHAGRVRRVRGGVQGRARVAGGHAQTRGHRLRPVHGRPVVGRQLRLRRRTRAVGSSRALTWVRAAPDDNGYARPVENVITVVDLNAMQVIAVEDYGVVPLPPEDANYSPEVAGARTDLKPIEIRQPEGPSFDVDGHEVRWQKWRLRVGFTPREGLVLHTVTLRGSGTRAADPVPRLASPTWWCRTAIRGRPTSAATPSTSASTASACSPTRSSSAATAWARSAISTRWPTTAAASR